MAGNLVIGGQLGSYLIESMIGRGGMSVVYRAVHQRLGTPVALKVLAPELSSDDAFRERFLREAKMAAGIDHPNVIPIYDTGLHEDSLYIVMRYVAGGDLKTLLMTSGLLTPERAVSVLTPVARALDAAHTSGLVHRDVKPGNILLQGSPSGGVEHVYLSDFGVTKSTTAAGGLTRTGALVGTVDYMAPEQIEGRDVTAQTDIYALASVFYQCVTGRVPYQRDSEAAALWAHVRDDYEPASRVRPELPTALDAAISRGLAKDPSARFASCEEFMRACSATPGVGASRVSDLEGLAGATVAESVPSPAAADETVWPGLESSPGGVTRPDRESARAAAPPPPAHPSQHSQPPAAAPPPPPARGNGGRSGAGAGSGGWISRHRGLAAGLAAVIVAGGVAAAIALSSGGSSPSNPTAQGSSFPATLTGVPTNRVTGTGDATVKLKGNTATVSIDTNGLLDAAPHAMHIHAGGLAKCPPASAAHLHNGQRAISTVNGEPFYGPPVSAMTTNGDISTNSILAFPRYPHQGNIRYTRTVTLPHAVATDIRQRKASIIVHGIDWNGNGLYDSVLDRSELDRHLPGEATAPALCGPLLKSSGTKADAGGGHLYTASLAVQGAQPVDARLWLCHVAASKPQTATNGA
jgi:serine/threonine protein kinase